MGTWEIVLWVFGIITAITTLMGIGCFLDDWIKKGEKNWGFIPLGLILLPVFVLISCSFFIPMQIEEIKSAGGLRNYRRMKKQKKLEDARKEEKRRQQDEEDRRLIKAYENGELARWQLPRTCTRENEFEFDKEMGLLSHSGSPSPGMLVYMENQYNETLNSFFQRNKGLQLYQKIKFTYLPHLLDVSEEEDVLRYFCPSYHVQDKPMRVIDSSFPLQYLCYPEDREKIRHGLFYLYGRWGFHRSFICGRYYPLEEGSDEEIIEQLRVIANDAYHNTGLSGGLYCTVKRPQTKEGSTRKYADELFSWIVSDNEVAGLVENVRKMLKRLEEKGINREILLTLFEKEPKLSRIVITKDLRITLPDYNDMEIEMEPLNKAVYLLFLRHPEGIVFKHLPDYRKELSAIYEQIKPNGLTDRARKSIYDVTNPCLNSINEKCARIRGAFISSFDENLAQYYYIAGRRGEPKKINLSEELIVWEATIKTGR